jgi:excisionase family DNA binding protein
VTTSEAAAVLDRSTRRVRQLIRQGVLGAIKRGRDWELNDYDVYRLAGDRIRDQKRRGVWSGRQ